MLPPMAERKFESNQPPKVRRNGCSVPGNRVDVVNDEPCDPEGADRNERNDHAADHSENDNIRAGVPNDTQHGGHVLERL